MPALILENSQSRPFSLKWLAILRPLNALLTFISVGIGAYLAWRISEWNWVWWRIIAAAVSASLILCAGNVFNDLCDQESDRINHPHRPLVQGTISRTGAWWVTILCAITGLILAFIISSITGIIALSVSVLLVIYSLYLQSMPLLGNLSVAVMAALTFPYGGLSVGSIRGTEYPAIFAVLFHLGREIVKDLEDRRGDAIAGFSTLAVRFGVQFPRIVASVILSVLIIATVIPFITGTYGLTYFFVVLFGVDGLLVGIIWKLWSSEDARSLRQVSMGLKAGMAIGLIAIILG
jgi:geranylgeranylglycerol-phosphate geranylgeranyltransferase